MEVSLLGTGLMGRAMAERLLDRGHELTVWNRTREKTVPLENRGAAVAGSIGAALAASDVVLLMLRDGPTTRDVLLAGRSAPDLSGRTVVQMATEAPAESLALAELVAGAGGIYLEAPVLGSTPQARQGKLLVMAGGELEVFERWSDLLEDLGRPRHVGPLGQAAALKLAFNQLIPALAAGFSLSLGLVRRRGIPVELFMGILRESPFFAPAFDQKLPRLLDRDFSDPHFPAVLLLKDVDLVRDEARQLGLDTAVVEAIRDVVERAIERGLGEGDYSALYEVIDPA